MPGGSLYEYLHRNHTMMELLQLVKFAIDVSSGMEYLHQNDIIHRDLKTANLLMDAESVCIHARSFFFVLIVITVDYFTNVLIIIH